ncbi:uncharacterized protein V6R79_017726 [Siganus canaliculatus]
MQTTKMLLFFLCFYFNIILVSGSSLSEQVHQITKDIFSSPGESAQVQCYHTIDSYFQILWYKQTEGKLQLLGYMYYDNPTLEDGLNVDIEGGANKGQKCTLRVKELTVSSSAVYYCAASNTTEPAYFGQGTKLTVLGEFK